jgi:hypothetical protein
MASLQTSPKSPVDTFIQDMHFGNLKPGSDATIHAALQGADMQMLAAFNRAMATGMRTRPNSSMGDLLLDSLNLNPAVG